MVNTTPELLAFLRRWEGVRHRVYLDSVGKPTVGVGHLVLRVDNLRVGDPVSDAQVDRFLSQDAQIAIKAVKDLVTVPITGNQFIALVSFVFNLGANTLRRSKLLHLLNQGEADEAADYFNNYVFAGHRRVQGLVNRRKAEQTLFLKAELDA